MAVVRQFACLLFCQVFLHTWKEAASDGHILVRFDSYVNAKGAGINGHCCDGKFGICQKNGCDHKFKICLHDPEYDMKSLDKFSEHNIQCAFGRADTIEIKNRNVIKHFGSTFGGINNPIVFPFYGELVPKLKLMVEVWDDDDIFHDDFVEMLTGYIDFHRAMGYDGAVLKRGFKMVLRGRTRLVVTLSVQCKDDFYGLFCGTYCAPPSHGANYHCNKDTGEKIYVCMPGFTGPTCEQVVIPPTMTQSPPPGDGCVTDCTGLPNGDYQSCNGCYFYVTCSNNVTHDNRPCPSGTRWNEYLKRCDYISDCDDDLGSGEM